MRVVIQSFNDVAGVREIGAMCNGASVVVVEHGDARHDFPTLLRPNLGRDYGAFVSVWKSKMRRPASATLSIRSARWRKVT